MNVTKSILCEEIATLESIYEKEWQLESRSGHIFSITITEGGREVLMFVTFPEDYPDSPPEVEINGPMLNANQKFQIEQALNIVYLENVGSTVIFQWIEKVREILQTYPPFGDYYHKNRKMQNHCKTKKIKQESTVNSMEIIHGDVIEDRKSSFQGHVARISKPEDVDLVLKELKKERKISSAKHNVYAWRCGNKYNCSDDGERQAGGKLMKLLDLTKADNVIIIITRWFGGIQLGNDRFKHYSNAARQVMQQANVIRR